MVLSAELAGVEPMCSHLYSLVACALLHAQKVGMAGYLIHHIIWNVLSRPAHAQLCHDSALKYIFKSLLYMHRPLISHSWAGMQSEQAFRLLQEVLL